MKFGFVLPYLDDVVTRIPLDRLLLETDAPYFPAPSHKLHDLVQFHSLELSLGPAGLSAYHLLALQVNIRTPGWKGAKPGPLKSHPGLVFLVASKIATMRGIAVGDVLKANRDNVRALYGI